MQKIYNTPLPVVENEVEQKENPKTNDETFITDVDMNIDNWQTKEGKAYTIKFPKEWYWLESEHEENEGYSEIITNNPNFDMDKYADISIGAGINYPLVLKNDTEVIISFSGIAGLSNSGRTPSEAIDSQIERMQKIINSQVDCSRVNSGDFPMAYCSFVDEENQKIQIYFVARKYAVYAFTARTTEKNEMENLKLILEQIAMFESDF